MKKENKATSPPENLDNYGKQWWVINIPIVEANFKTALTPCDYLNLEMLASMYSQIREAESHIVGGNAVVEYSNGNEGLNKWEVVYNKKIKLYYDLACEYGLTPLSKSKLDRSQNRAENSGDGLDDQEKTLKDLVKQFG